MALLTRRHFIKGGISLGANPNKLMPGLKRFSLKPMSFILATPQKTAPISNWFKSRICICNRLNQGIIT